MRRRGLEAPDRLVVRWQHAGQVPTTIDLPPLATRLPLEPDRRLFPLRFLCFLPFLLFQDETNNIQLLFAKTDRLSAEVRGAAIEVHRIMGPALLEGIYERCLPRELELRGIPVLKEGEIAVEDGLLRFVLPGANSL